MTITIAFQWTDEIRYRRQFDELLPSARSTTELGFLGGEHHVYVTPEYQAVLDRPCSDCTPNERHKIYVIGVSYIEGCALLAVADGLVPAQLGRAVFVHHEPIAWTDHEGLEFAAVDTVFVAIDGKVLVATAGEFRLGASYLVDRQLFRAEVAFILEELKRYKQQGGDPDAD